MEVKQSVDSVVTLTLKMNADETAALRRILLRPRICDINHPDDPRGTLENDVATRIASALPRL